MHKRNMMKVGQAEDNTTETTETTETTDTNESNSSNGDVPLIDEDIFDGEID